MYGAAVLDHELEGEAGACLLDCHIQDTGSSLCFGATSGSYSVILMAATTIPSPHSLLGHVFFLYSAYNFYDLTLKQKIRRKKNLICVIQNFETFFDQILTKITI